MHKIYPLVISVVLMIAIQSCSKKTHPGPAVTNPGTNNTTTPVTTLPATDPGTDSLQTAKKLDSVAVTKPVVIKKKKEAAPKVITVNDKYASKSVDGRLYYDLEGHRYWRSNKDGKYYLFNKSMLTDDDFKKPN